MSQERLLDWFKVFSISLALVVSLLLVILTVLSLRDDLQEYITTIKHWILPIVNKSRQWIQEQIRKWTKLHLIILIICLILAITIIIIEIVGLMYWIIIERLLIIIVLIVEFIIIVLFIIVN